MRMTEHASDEPVPMNEHTPWIKDPAARSVRRVGVVDIGSNSVRLVVFDGAARSPHYFFNEKIMAGLGKVLRNQACSIRQGVPGP